MFNNYNTNVAPEMVLEIRGTKSLPVTTSDWLVAIYDWMDAAIQCIFHVASYGS